MTKFAKFSGPGAGLVIIIALLVFHWGAVYKMATWSAERTIEKNRAEQAAREAEFNQRAMAMEEQQKLMLQALKLHEYQLRSMAPVSRSAPARSRHVLVTAYTCNDGDKKPGDAGYCVTTSGHVLQQSDAWKIVAADPAYYRFGQQLYIEGVGPVTVADTGSLVKGPNRLDLFVGEIDIGLAKTWGSVRKEVRI